MNFDGSPRTGLGGETLSTPYAPQGAKRIKSINNHDIAPTSLFGLQRVVAPVAARARTRFRVEAIGRGARRLWLEQEVFIRPLGGRLEQEVFIGPLGGRLGEEVFTRPLGGRLGVVLVAGGVRREAPGLAAAVGGRVGLVALVALVLVLVLALAHRRGEEHGPAHLGQGGGGHALPHGRTATRLGERPAKQRGDGVRGQESRLGERPANGHGSKGKGLENELRQETGQRSRLGERSARGSKVKTWRTTCTGVKGQGLESDLHRGQRSRLGERPATETCQRSRLGERPATGYGVNGQGLANDLQTADGSKVKLGLANDMQTQTGQRSRLSERPATGDGSTGQRSLR